MCRCRVARGKPVRACGTAFWKLALDDISGIYRCSVCGHPAPWARPGLRMQVLDLYCGNCGRKMGNPCRDLKQSGQDFVSRTGLLKEIADGRKLGFSHPDWILWVIRHMPSV